MVVLLISGTASIDEEGRTVHGGDFRAQLRRTYHNITGLLKSEGASWKDIVRTTCYLRDIDRDYEAFNEERTRFYDGQGLDPLPASTGDSGDFVPAGSAGGNRGDCGVSETRA